MMLSIEKRRSLIFIVSIIMTFFAVSLGAENVSFAVSKKVERNFLDNKANQDHQRNKNTLVWGTKNNPTIINPILTQSSVSSTILELIFDSLVRIGKDGKILPGLASSWDVSEDGLEYIFYLQQGVLFHDGTECTAEDIKFTYDLINDPKNRSPWRSNTELVEEWVVLDKYTLKMILKEAYPAILSYLVREIAPKQMLENQDIHTSNFNYNPIGTGPFKFYKWDRSTDQIELVANLDYFEGRPYLDRIIIKCYEDNSHLWSAFLRGEIDFVKYLNIEDYLVLKRDPSFKTYVVEWEMYCALLYNLNDSILADKEVRYAIAKAINVEALMSAVSDGGTVSTGPFHPDSLGFNKEVRKIKYDPLEAKMDLLHRGWRDIDNNGVLEKDRRELEIRMLVDSRNEYYIKMAKIIRQQLAEIGIKVKLLLYDDDKKLTKEYIKSARPQAWLRLFQGLGNDVCEASTSWYSLSSQSGKLWDYKNERVDDLFESGRITKSDKEREKIYKEIHEIIYSEQPACFLFFPVSYHAISSRFKNTDEFFCWEMPVYTLKDWRLK